MTGLEAQLAGARDTNSQLVQRLQESQRETEQERARAEAQRIAQTAQRARAKQLEEILKDLHRTMLTGNVYALILKACLTITGASRGVYVTTRGRDLPLRIRAAVDVDGYPQSEPSEFLKALCLHVLDTHETLVAQSETDLASLPQPAAPTEQFHNCIVAPVSLMKNLNGIVIAADKVNGDFDAHDVQSVLSVGDQAAVAAENHHLRRQLQEAYLSTVSVMADAMEAKDSYTQGHSEAVCKYARLIGRHLNLSDLERSVVSYAALLHDIGKIGVSDGILNKPGPLLPEERELVRTHVRIGHDLIQHVPAFQAVAEAVLHHHEYYDGSGYPIGLKGDDIPVASRIVCVVDSYSAMITKRSYKEAYSDEWARNELRRCAGTQFDPRVVEAFLYVLDLPDLDQIDEEEVEKMELLPAAIALQRPAEAAAARADALAGRAAARPG
jgi:HD-GYP domain-containing protein (c-di-GMP phosphodiesterase class II)